MLEISFSYHNLDAFDYQFNLTSNFLSELFIRKLNERNFKIPGIQKVSIELIKNRTENLMLENEGVLIFKSNFDLLNSAYDVAISSKYERLKILLSSFLKIADKFSLDKKTIYDVYEECCENDLRNEYYWGDSTASTENHCYASLFCVHEEYHFFVFLDIFKRGTNELIHRQELFTTDPYWFRYRDFLVPVKAKKEIFFVEPKGGLPLVEVGIPRL
jgi:hypothetical protein